MATSSVPVSVTSADAPLHVVLCLFGVVQRSIRVTWPAIQARVVDVLRASQISVTVAVFSMDVGDALIDGCRVDADDVKLVPYDHIEVVQQSDVDAIINSSCTPSLQHCPILTRQHLSLATRRNALRQMYSEAVVGRFLKRTAHSIDAAVVIGPDFFPFDNLSIADVRIAASNRNITVISSTNPSGSYTNGYYIGHPIPVSKVLQRIDPYFAGRLPVQSGRGYEAHLQAGFALHGVHARLTEFFYVKVRASASLQRLSLFFLCKHHTNVRCGLSAGGLAWARSVLARLLDTMTPPDGAEHCTSEIPTSMLSRFRYLALEGAPANRYLHHCHVRQPPHGHDAMCMEANNNLTHGGAHANQHVLRHGEDGDQHNSSEHPK